MTDEETKKDQIEKKTIKEQKNSMEEKEQKSKKSDSLEDKSLEELHKQIEKGKRKASRSIVFAIAAIIAIIAIGVAWFVSNTKVSAIGARISADNPVSFELGSAGKRQSAETNYLRVDGQSLVEGETRSAGSTDSGSSGSIITDEDGNPIYVGTSNLAWRLGSSDTVFLSPGASGKFEFYIIPKKDNLTQATVTIDMDAYTLDNSKIAQKSDDTVLQNLIDGHILLFLGLSNDAGYSEWIGSNSLSVKATDSGNSITVSVLSGNETDNQTSDAAVTFIKDKPYKVTLYWVWPKYFRNYVYKQRSQQGDLFTESVNVAEYNQFIKFVNDQKTFATSKLFYNEKSSSTDANISSIEGNISETMEDELINTCNTYYNQADEYIGRKADFVYVGVTVTDSAQSN